MSINLLDILFIVVLAFFSVRGILRGFIVEILSKASIILGIAAAVFFSGSLFRLLSRYLGDGVWVQIIAFLLLFVVGFFLVKVLEGFLQKGMERLNLQQLDKFLGFFVGATEGFLLVAVILFLLQIQPFIDLEELLSGSVFGRFFLPFLEPERLGLQASEALWDV